MGGGELEELLQKAENHRLPMDQALRIAQRGVSGAGVCAWPGHHPPRPEAGQRLAQRGRQRQARRLRPCRGPRPLPRHPGGHDGGHRRLHAAGAGPRPPGRRPQRPLLAGGDALRDGGGPPALPGRRRRGRHLPAHQHGAGGALLAQSGGAAGPGGADHAAAGQSAGGAPRERRRRRTRAAPHPAKAPPNNWRYRRQPRPLPTSRGSTGAASSAGGRRWTSSRPLWRTPSPAAGRW